MDQGDAQAFNLSGYIRNLPENRPEILETLTSKDSDFYNLNDGIRLCLIFNGENFKNSQFLPRDGTGKDVEKIRETFEKLDFVVELVQDPIVDEIKDKIGEIQKRNELCCLALFILTHGEADGLLHAHDSSYRLNKTIIAELLPDHCPSLAGRPKLIFIQACQGKRNKFQTKIRKS